MYEKLQIFAGLCYYDPAFAFSWLWYEITH